MHSDPSPADRPQPGVLILVAGLGGTLVALFGLPLQSVRGPLGNGFYFGDIRRYSHPEVVARVTMSPVAAAWWNYLGYLLAGLLVLLVGVTAAVPAARRSAAQVTAALGVATAAIYTIALFQTSHLEDVFVNLRRVGTSFDADRYGIWATYAGLVGLVVGAIMVAVAAPPPAPAAAGTEPGAAAEPDVAAAPAATTEPDVAAAPATATGLDAAVEPATAAESASVTGPDAATGSGEEKGTGPATGAR